MYISFHFQNISTWMHQSRCCCTSRGGKRKKREVWAGREGCVLQAETVGIKFWYVTGQRETTQVDYRIVSNGIELPCTHRLQERERERESQRRLNMGLDWAVPFTWTPSSLTITPDGTFFFFLSCSVHLVLITRPRFALDCLSLDISWFFFFLLVSALLVLRWPLRKLGRHS